MKNPNGFGTTYKLKGNRRKKWVARKTVAWEDGKQKRVIVGYFESKKEAMEALASYVYNPNAKVTLKDIYTEWSKVHFQKLTVKTKISIENMYNKHIFKMEDMYISEIKLNILQDFFDKLELSTGTIKSIRSILNMIFNYALKKEIILKNPLEFVEFKKHEVVVEKHQFSYQEIEKLWENKEMYLVDSILILIYTGMRISEMLELKTTDVNLENENKILHIRKSKTVTGIRDIPISPLILPLICKRLKLNNEYLISNQENKKFVYTAYRFLFKKVMKELEMNHSIHECRHTTATLLSDAGANPVSIAKILGHTDYNLTSKVYTHKDKTQLQKAIDLI